ncbi:glycosyltransferase family 4 protein [Paenibacillus sp.]|uniref:glycosyltransferase family 4 protein n=1 Tax=Paenibacillus sp. TaxID=58172 RepID=UPI002D5DB65A|nr:glycosyltransferase family 4 protein [Paenibacillus sp.]HZG58501.1 glycosyltransferase family 4 protein [Paenibacillus sp.]
MKILVVCQHFWPEEFRINDLCATWVERGHEVDVICGAPNYPAGAFFDGYGFRKKRRETYRGVRVFRSALVPRGKGNPIQIFLNYVSFPIFALREVWELRKNDYDAILVFQITPIFMAFPAWVMKKLFQPRAKTYMYIQDLWPESLYSVVPLRAKLFRFAIDRVSEALYRRFEYFLTTSKGIRERVLRTYQPDPDKVLFLPNWAEALYGTRVGNPALRERYAGAFVVLFAGNIGPAQSFDTIVKAAKRLADEGLHDVKWVIVGDGLSRPAVEAQVRELGITEAVHFLGRQPVERMPEYYDIADGLLVSLVRSDLFRMTIPSKLQSYLASGKPIVASLDGEGAAIVEESGAGLACESENPQALADIVKELRAMPAERRAAMGRAGQAYFRAHYDKELLLDRLTRFMEG